MKTKTSLFFAISTMLVFVLSSCASAPTISTPIPSTTTATSLASPTGTLTNTPISPAPTLVPESAFIKGITLNYSGNGPKLGTTDAQEVVAQYIIPSGANYVVLVPSCWSIDMRDTSIICPKENIEGGVPAISDAELIGAIQYLHSVGLRVAFKPQALIQSVHIAENERKERHWTEEQWEQWFNSYTQFIIHYAQIAENYHVDLFVVGNEQEDNTSREKNWREVIAAVRNVYHGPITYAANAWSFEAYRIRFWDALDYIGTNGYQFGFVSKNEPTEEDMIQAWQPYIQRLEEMSNEYGKQVIITEIGARPMEDFNTGRANDSKAWAYDAQEQSDYYTAFFEALKDKPWLKGIIIWDMDTDPLQGGLYDIGYSFIAQPAEKVVHKYFGGAPIMETVTPDFVEDRSSTIIVYEEGLTSDWHAWIDPNAPVKPDLFSPPGHESSRSIRLPLSQYQGIGIDSNLPFVHMSKFKWLEFYIMVGENEPKNLLVQFEYWTPNLVSHSRRALVNDPNYIEGRQFQPGKWQLVRIPLVDLGITDQTFTGFGINNCAWPCQLDPKVDDVYIDDIRLIAGKSQ